MQRLFPLFVFGVFLSALAQSAFAVSGDDVMGLWFTKNNKSKVEIYRCDGNKYCGKIVWLKEPQWPVGDPDAGKDKTDRNNPDKAKQSHPLLGLQIMHSFVFDGDDEWEDGKIYDPENGKTYSCYMELDGADTLRVRGYIGISLIGRTAIWVRAQ